MRSLEKATRIKTKDYSIKDEKELDQAYEYVKELMDEGYDVLAEPSEDLESIFVSAVEFTERNEETNITELYYTPPEDDIFYEVRDEAIELWKEVDSDNDKYGYASSKINKIKDIENVSDNFMYIIAMFDDSNQRILADRLSTAARKAIRERMLDGGQPPMLIYF